jgi:predicted ABC-type sugar transport system permease subunit
MLLGALLMTLKPSSFLTSSVSTISGTVSNLNNELLEYVNPEKPTHDHSSVYYQRFFVSKFNLGDRAIEAKFSIPMVVNDSDTLRVSGYQKGDSFQVLAYANLTQQVSKHENWIVLALGALFFLGVAIGLLNSELVAEGAIVPKLFLLGFVGVAMYMVYRALLIREAISLLQN